MDAAHAYERYAVKYAMSHQSLFREEDHPRDDSGKFSEKDGGGSVKKNQTEKQPAKGETPKEVVPAELYEMDDGSAFVGIKPDLGTADTEITYNRDLTWTRDGLTASGDVEIVVDNDVSEPGIEINEEWYGPEELGIGTAGGPATVEEAAERIRAAMGESQNLGEPDHAEVYDDMEGSEVPGFESLPVRMGTWYATDQPVLAWHDGDEARALPNPTKEDVRRAVAQCVDAIADAMFQATQSKYARDKTMVTKLSRQFDTEIAKYAWDESKHPRGQPGNAGQFGPGGGGGAKGKDGGDDKPKDPAAAAPPKNVEGEPPEPAAEAVEDSSGGAGTRSLERMQNKFAMSDTPPPPGKSYSPNVEETDEDGVTKAAVVGVPGRESPPPPKEIPRLPNLTPSERQAEGRFAQAYLNNPDGMATEMRRLMAEGKLGDGPQVFSTDEAKYLSQDYIPVQPGEGQKATDIAENLQAMSVYNTAVHQTANALAKRAFIQRLDELAAGNGPKHVLVTAGGVAAGKGYAVENAPEVQAIQDNAGAVWDTAGEQNSTELPWVLEECEKRGIGTTFAFVHTDPVATWNRPGRGVVERARKKGRMVDARAFADSYEIGARNFAAFAKKHADNPNVGIFYMDNDRTKPDGSPDTPVRVDSMPPAAMQVNRKKLFATALEDLGNSSVPARIKRGGSNGIRIWGGA